NDNKRKRKRSNKNAPVNPNAVTGQKGTNEGNANRGGGGGFNKAGGQQKGGYKQGQGNQQQHAHGKGRHDHRGEGRHHERPKEERSEKESQDQIKATLARLSGAGKSGKFAQRAKLRRQKRDDIALSAEAAAMEEAAQSRILRVTEFVTANELANLMDVQVTQVISTCMSLGMFVSINQRLDAEVIAIVAEEGCYQFDLLRSEY